MGNKKKGKGKKEETQAEDPQQAPPQPQAQAAKPQPQPQALKAQPQPQSQAAKPPAQAQQPQAPAQTQLKPQPQAPQPQPQPQVQAPQPSQPQAASSDQPVTQPAQSGESSSQKKSKKKGKGAQTSEQPQQPKQEQGKPTEKGPAQETQPQQQAQPSQPQPQPQSQPQQPQPQQTKQAPQPQPQGGKPAPQQPTPQGVQHRRPPPPGTGTGARIPKNDGKTHLITNMYGLNEISINQIAAKVKRYEIDVDGNDKPSPSLVRTLVYAMRRQEPFIKVVMFCDGSKILYALQSLEPIVDDAVAKGLVEEVAEMSISKEQPKKPRVKHVPNTGIFVDVYHPKSHKPYKLILRPAGWNSNDTLQKSQMLQVAIKYSFYEENREIVIRGRNMYYPDINIGISLDLLLFEGIFQSARFNGYSKPIINVDLCYMVAMNSNLNIFEWLQESAKYWQFRNLADAFRNKEFVEFLRYNLSGMLVRAQYGANTTYRLEGLDERATPANTTFEDKEGKTVSLKDYLLKTYGQKVDPNGPVLTAKQMADKPPKSDDGSSSSSASKKKKKPSPRGPRTTYLVAEGFKFTIGQRRKGVMSSEERTRMIDATRKKPSERFQEISKHVPKLLSNLKNQSLDIGLNPKNIEIDARVLQPKTVMYKTPVVPRNGGWDHSKFMSTCQTPAKWAILHDGSNTVNTFCNYFQGVTNQLALNLAQPQVIDVRGDSFATVIRKAPADCKLVLCFIPARKAEPNIYEKIKLVTYIERGMASQCVIDEAYRKKGEMWTKVLDNSVMRNIAASINAKLDAENCVVKEEEMKAILGTIDPGDVMVLGLDVFHGETSDPEGKPSVVALCASRTRHFNKYTTSLRRQNARQELVVVEEKSKDKAAGQVDNLTPMLNEVLAGRGKLPSTVIFYRDGVGEGMYERVIDFEIQALQATLLKIYTEKGQKGPKLTYIVVQKRHHFRSQCTDQTSRDSNPPPGTLVDDLLIVDEGQPNFYLYSHKALAGTARPTHYQLLWDENNLSKDQLAHFTYALCHLHQGCTKTVSIPAPVYYADLACGIAGSCFRDRVEQINERLRQTLYMI